MSKWRALVLAVLLTAMSSACGLASGASTSPTPLPVVVDLAGITAEGRLEPTRYARLAPSLDGVVSEVLVAEGAEVEAGQLIARLDNAHAVSLEQAESQVSSELGLAYQALRTAQSRLDDFPMPQIFVGLTAEEATRKWLAELDASNATFAPYKETSRKALRPRSAFTWRVYSGLPPRVLEDTGEYEGMALVYKKRVDVAWMNYKKAVQWLELDSAVASAQARVDDAQRRYERLHAASLTDVDAATRAALATGEIRAPFAGTITEMHLKIGELVPAGTPVLTLADYSSWVVKTTDLTEIDVTDIAEGMPVTVTLDAIPAASLSGTVGYVGLAYGDRQGDIVYPITIELADADPRLRWGMTAQVTFGD